MHNGVFQWPYPKSCPTQAKPGQASKHLSCNRLESYTTALKDTHPKIEGGSGEPPVTISTLKPTQNQPHEGAGAS
jgi:hypothetical protein